LNLDKSMIDVKNTKGSILEQRNGKIVSHNCLQSISHVCPILVPFACLHYKVKVIYFINFELVSKA
jgi:hypothetical protein